MAPVKQLICVSYVDKSTILSDLKCASSFRWINQSCSNHSGVQIILLFHTAKIRKLWLCMSNGFTSKFSARISLWLAWWQWRRETRGPSWRARGRQKAGSWGHSREGGWSSRDTPPAAPTGWTPSYRSAQSRGSGRCCCCCCWRSFSPRLGKGIKDVQPCFIANFMRNFDCGNPSFDCNEAHRINL